MPSAAFWGICHRHVGFLYYEKRPEQVKKYHVAGFKNTD